MNHTVVVSSRLGAAPAEVWAHASTMEGVNRELAPWLRMSFPREASGRRLSSEDVGRVLFTSTLSILGVVPYDRHALQLVRVVPEQGFTEESTSWTMRKWRHERAISFEEGGCVITDRVTFEPRFLGVGPLVKRIVDRVFQHRHAVLRRLFGDAARENREPG